MTYTTDVRMHTGGSPGSYTNSFTIASVTNTSMSGVMGKFNGVAAIPGDTGETYGAKNFSTLDTSRTRAARRMIMSSSAIPSRARASTACLKTMQVST